MSRKKRVFGKISYSNILSWTWALIVKRILLRNQRKSMEKSMENIQSDFRIKNVRNSQELIKLTIRLNVSLK